MATHPQYLGQSIIKNMKCCYRADILRNLILHYGMIADFQSHCTIKSSIFNVAWAWNYVQSWRMKWVWRKCIYPFHSYLHLCHALPTFLIAPRNLVENSIYCLRTCCVPLSAPYLTVTQKHSYPKRKKKENKWWWYKSYGSKNTFTVSRNLGHVLSFWGGRWSVCYSNHCILW